MSILTHAGFVSPDVESCELQSTVFFIGFMGAGKTTVARKLARMCGCVSIDTDAYVGQLTGMHAATIIQNEGEDSFRTTETYVLRELANRPPLFVSCGGGIVERAENREILKKKGFVVFLDVTTDEARSRISNLATRPLLGDAEAARQRNEARHPLYDQVADLSICTDGMGTGAIARRIRHCLIEAGILKPLPKDEDRR